MSWLNMSVLVELPPPPVITRRGWIGPREKRRVGGGEREGREESGKERRGGTGTAARDGLPSSSECSSSSSCFFLNLLRFVKGCACVGGGDLSHLPLLKDELVLFLFFPSRNIGRGSGGERV